MLNGKKVTFDSDSNLIVAPGDTFLVRNDNGLIKRDVKIHAQQESFKNPVAIGPD